MSAGWTWRHPSGAPAPTAILSYGGDRLARAGSVRVGAGGPRPFAVQAVGGPQGVRGLTGSARRWDAGLARGCRPGSPERCRCARGSRLHWPGAPGRRGLWGGLDRPATGRPVRRWRAERRACDDNLRKYFGALEGASRAGTADPPGPGSTTYCPFQMYSERGAKVRRSGCGWSGVDAGAMYESAGLAPPEPRSRLEPEEVRRPDPARSGRRSSSQALGRAEAWNGRRWRDWRPAPTDSPII